MCDSVQAPCCDYYAGGKTGAGGRCGGQQVCQRNELLEQKLAVADVDARAFDRVRIPAHCLSLGQGAGQDLYLDMQRALATA